MHEIETFARDGGFGFVIKKDGSVVFFQPSDPDQPGDAPMTEERALEAGQAVLERLEA